MSTRTLLFSTSKVLVAISASLGLLSACSSEGTQTDSKSWIATAQVHNPSNFVRNDQDVYVSFYDLGISADNSKNIAVTNNGQAVESELIDKDFDGKKDGVLAVLDMTAGQNVTLDYNFSSANSTSSKRTQAEVSEKVGGKWVQHSRYPDKPLKEYQGGHFENVDVVKTPDHYTDHSYWLRYEGPGIESDKVGYRVYLDWRNGFDIFGKLTKEPVLQNVGVDGYDSYHEMQPWGMDLLKVGSSLGSGGFGLWHDNKVTRVSKTQGRNARILSSGNLHSAFAIDYIGWQHELGTQDVTANIAMQAGSHLAQVRLDLDKAAGPIATGIVKHKNTEFLQGNLDITGKAHSYIASWGPQSLDGKNLGMAIFFKKEYLDETRVGDKNYLAILNPKGTPQKYNKDTQQLNYYFAAVWQAESGIKTKEAFVEYLEQQTERLTVQPRIRLTTKLSQHAKSDEITAEKALSWSTKLADSEINRKGYTYKVDGWDLNRRRLPKFEYDIVGLYPHTMNRLADATGDEKYRQSLHKITGSFINDDGSITRYKAKNHSVDNIAPGRAVLALYKQTKEQKYKVAAKRLRDSMYDHPKTSEGAFWHKKKYTHQLWLDGVYMAMPFLAEYALMFERGDDLQHSLEEVAKEFELTRKYLKDPETGYYYHGWDEKKLQNWADPETGVSPEFWGRGMGWLAMAIVDVLDIIPEQYEDIRQPIIELAKEVAEALERSQDAETGTWWQVMDKPDNVGNYRESSATGMFVYFLATAIDQGYIDEKYQGITMKGYQGLINEFTLVHDNGEISLKNICYVAGLGFGRDGSYQYYMSEPQASNDPKGTVPYMLAGIAVHDMLK
ncbi:MAG: glycoside hydrolase family 88 protein [Gammaproteobacteria bacterium]|nr:glycoside hydrolase family 88 protein [Gammaproteobacteria bacterium]